MASATDIITYIGVPLAVLGVMPILYTTIRALIIKERIRRQFACNGLSDAIIRGSPMSLVIEIEVPRYSLAPMSRSQAKYWKLNPNPSSMKGGSWSIFNWEMMIVGHYIYKVKETYRGELRQPQAEVDFEELVVFLMDRGAKPHAEGFKMLRQSGLWTGRGTRLLISPDSLDSVLKIVPPDDSDGKLSLALNWSAEWDHRDVTSLSPYWMRVKVPRKSPEKIVLRNPVEPTPACKAHANSEAVENPPLLVPGSSIRFHFLTNGVQSAYSESPTHLSEPLYIDHLRTRSQARSGPALWFSCTATALGNTSNTQLWGYTIPNEVLTFAHKNTVPCGVLILLKVLSNNEAGDWHRLYNPNLEEEISRAAQEREVQQWELSIYEDPAAESSRSGYWPSRNNARQCQKASRSRKKNEEAKITDAITSQTIDSRKIALAALSWLQKETPLPEMSAKEAVEMLLYQMLVDSDTALAIGAMLDEWKGWSDGGAMTKANLKFVMENKIAFAYAILMVDIIKGMEETVEGSLASDLQACVKVWEKVRLG
ncbi:MAG: hypothetical protein M1813_007701 [Trichoglossum hirsutum]|nr:MAG: hypothetical protein M1813_007701 [Trichoglossum hirsutum]